MDAPVTLERRRSSRIAAGVCGIALVAAALAWATFCLTEKPGPGAVRGAQVMILLLSLAAVPMLGYATRLLLDAMSGGKILVEEDLLSIVLPRTLRRPIKLDRSVVAGVLVEEDAVKNNDERLRFPVDRDDGDATYLYSSISGSDLPILSPERAIPNLAIVFEQPLEFTEPRRRRFSRDYFSPLRPLQPSLLVPGMLLRAADPVHASLQLASWSDPEHVRGVLGGSPSVSSSGSRPTSSRRGVPALRRPLSRERATASIWSSLPLIGALLGLSYVGGHASFTASRAALFLVALVLVLSGGVLDTRLRYQERGRLARVLSIGLAGIGLMIALVVAVLGTTSS